MDFSKDELLEAKRQIDSTLHKLRETVKTLEAKEQPQRYKSQLTLAKRRIQAYRSPYVKLFFLILFLQEKGRLPSGGIMEQYKIDRINELARKNKAQGLTEAEKAERELLRREYIDSVVGSLTGQLEHTYLVDDKGNKTKLRRKEGK